MNMLMPYLVMFRVASWQDSPSCKDPELNLHECHDGILGGGDNPIKPPVFKNRLKLHGCFVFSNKTRAMLSLLFVSWPPRKTQEIVKKKTDSFHSPKKSAFIQVNFTENQRMDFEACDSSVSDCPSGT